MLWIMNYQNGHKGRPPRRVLYVSISRGNMPNKPNKCSNKHLLRNSPT